MHADKQRTSGRCRSRLMSGTASSTASHETMNVRENVLTTKMRSRNIGMNLSTSNDPASVTTKYVAAGVHRVAAPLNAPIPIS
jgi:hypothetical protein